MLLVDTRAISYLHERSMSVNRVYHLPRVTSHETVYLNMLHHRIIRIQSNQSH